VVCSIGLDCQWQKVRTDSVFLAYCGIGRREPLPKWYHPRFTSDRFGLFIACSPEQFSQVQTLLASANPEETRVFE